MAGLSDPSAAFNLPVQPTLIATQQSLDSSNARTAPPLHPEGGLGQDRRHRGFRCSNPNHNSPEPNTQTQSDNIVAFVMSADDFSPYYLQRSVSPAPTADYSIIDVDVETFPSAQYQPLVGYGDDSAHNRVTHSRSLPLSMPFSSKRGSHSSPSLSLSVVDNTHDQATYPGDLATPTEGQYDFFDHPDNPSPSNSMKTILPRIWEALSSPGKSFFLNVASPSSSAPPSFPSLSPFSPSARQQNTGGGTFPRWKGKGKGKTVTSISDWGSQDTEDPFLDFTDSSVLDGDEGELIDDEACFVDVRAVTGVDILSLLPTELALHILILLCAPISPLPRTSPNATDLESYPYPIYDSDALHSILACLSVSRKWRALASDNSVWQALFMGRWAVDFRRANSFYKAARPRCTKLARIDSRPPDPGRMSSTDRKDPNVMIQKTTGRLISPQAMSMSWPGIKRATPRLVPPRNAPLQLDWRRLYRERYELENRWSGNVRPIKPAFIDVYNYPGLSRPDTRIKWEPKMIRIDAHMDSVYCLEFDSQRIITGSRDHTIKVWSVRTGRLLGTFWGAHKGSILCLKFEHDWDQGDIESPVEGDQGSSQSLFHDMSSRPGCSESPFLQHFPMGHRKRGLMVSGSSDHNICVWDIWTGRPLPHDEANDKEVNGEVRAILKGHVGGVLDLKINVKWIVSCSKDTVVRVWDRDTLKPLKILRGHDGPVNAIGLQNGQVVSASGDGKMILWDIESGERLRTFEGHDRGLACIEFKADLIVSGSNDCKIKVWSASSGECLQTLIGHTALVRALSFDPRNNRLVSGSYDKTVMLWDLKTGKLISNFAGRHTGQIFDVKLDISRIVSASHDRHIVVLDFSHGLDASLFV